jgi:hypothetical protein
MSEKLLTPDFSVKPARAVAVKRRVYSDCKHLSIEVDEVLRTVYCRRCKVQVDPVQYLIDWSHEDRRRDLRVQEIRDFEVKAKFDAAIKRFRAYYKKAAWFISAATIVTFDQAGKHFIIAAEVRSLGQAIDEIGGEAWNDYKIHFQLREPAPNQTAQMIPFGRKAQENA